MAVVTAPPETRSGTGRLRPVASALASEWREVGGLGRVAAFGLLLSGVVAVLLGLWIQGSVRHHLLDVRTDLIEGIVDQLAADRLLPLGTGRPPDARAIDAAIEHRLIGGEIVGVAIHDSTGETVYGDPGGTTGWQVAPGGRDPHVEQHADGLLHFVVPVDDPEGRLTGTFEVFQQAGSFNEVLSRVRRNVWLAITTGLGSLGISMGAFTLAHARVLDRRRRYAEALLRKLLRAEEEERRRIVGSLHDDIGQPLYRLLYGLEGCRARLTTGSEIDAELERLGALVRDMDATLRAELHHLHRSSFDALDLTSALLSIARDCREECGLVIDVDIDIDLDREPASVSRSVLLRAVQEGVLNVRKHAEATHVSITATSDERGITVEVVDDGCGPSGPAGLGLTTASERLDAVDGGLTIARSTDGGTVLRAWVPHETEVER